MRLSTKATSMAPHACEGPIGGIATIHVDAASPNFLVQEMNREVNTIGSKANDAMISREVVVLKTELEKFREQAQNVE